MKNKDYLKKYRYLGNTFLSIPNTWIPLVTKLIEDIDKLARPKWMPRFLLNWFYWLAMGKSVVRIRSWFWYNLWRKLPIKCQITQIKDKFGGLRFYCSASEEIMKLVEEAEEKSYSICEKCGSMDDVKQVGNGWIYTLCKNCDTNRLNNNLKGSAE
jgi:hypothetical protein